MASGYRAISTLKVTSMILYYGSRNLCIPNPNNYLREGGGEAGPPRNYLEVIN